MHREGNAVTLDAREASAMLTGDGRTIAIVARDREGATAVLGIPDDLLVPLVRSLLSVAAEMGAKTVPGHRAPSAENGAVEGVLCDEISFMAALDQPLGALGLRFGGHWLHIGLHPDMLRGALPALAKIDQALRPPPATAQ